MAFILQILCQIQSKITGLWKNRSLWPLFWVEGHITLTHCHKVGHSSIKYYSKYKAHSVDHEKLGHCDLHCLRSKAASHWLIITKYDANISNSLQNQWTMKYRSQWPTNILRSNFRSYCFIIPKYVYTSKSLQDIRQNHWTMKYRAQWSTFILRSNNTLHWLVIPKYDVHISNSLQDIRQNNWTMKYRLVTYIYFEVKHRVILTYFPKVCCSPSNSLQDKRQNDWAVECRSCWPSPHDIQVNVVRFTHVWPTISINCLHNRKAENYFLKVS